MTEEELNTIEARANAATEAWVRPWVCIYTVLHVAKGAHSPAEHAAGNCDASQATEEDEIFLEHAREDIPALIAEVRRLREEVADLHHVRHERDLAQAGRDSLLQELQGVKQQLSSLANVLDRPCGCGKPAKMMQAYCAEHIPES